MKINILSSLSVLILGIILTNISCEKLEVVRITKLNTGEALDITHNSANVQGLIIDVSDDVHEIGHCWNTKSNPDINSSKVLSSNTYSKGAGIQTAMTNLLSEITYYVRAYAITNKGEVYGHEISFSTTEEKEITITSPVSTDRWPVGSTHQIAWTDNIDEQVRIELWRQGESSMYREITGAIESFDSYNWIIPTDIPLEVGWRIKIISTPSENTIAFSDEFEMIGAQTIEVAEPSGGQYLHMGNNYSINWQSNFGGSVKITLFMNDGIHSDLITSTENDGQYDWQILNDGSIMARADYSINISSVEDPYIYHTASWFEIGEAPFISISAPAIGVDWQMGNTQNITWTDNIVENIRIELFKGGNLELEIANSISSNGTHNWTIPNGMVAGADYSIKITGVINGTYTAESAQFTISEATGSSGTVTDYNNNTYPTVKIGNQWWMAENLKATHYSDGTEITLVTLDTDWSNLVNNNTDKAYCYYANNSSYGDVYGALYTWAAAMNGEGSSFGSPSGVQGVCPTGWHLPSDNEWKELVDYLGGISVAGGKLKEAGTTHWSSPNEGATNESGFTALGSGERFEGAFGGGFHYIAENAFWWTATENSDNDALRRYVRHTLASTGYNSPGKSTGCSVRCVQD